MTTTKLKHASDSYVREDTAKTNYNDHAKLMLSDQASSDRIAFIYFGGGPRPGVFVVSAKLVAYVRGNWVGTPTLTVKRVTQKWSEGTLTWRNKPSTTDTGSASAQPGTPDPGTPIEWDVTSIVRTAFQGAGAPFFGFQISSTGTDVRALHSSETANPDLRPWLEITYTEEPSQPIDLTPGDGTVVSIASPTLGWRQFDVDGDEQVAFNIQINATNVWTAPAYDSGWITSDQPEVNLATTGFSGISDGQTKYWRVRAQDSTGQISAWSEAQSISREDKGTLEILAPTSQVLESTPEIITKLTGGTQEALEYILEEQQLDSSYIETWKKRRFEAPSADGVSYEFEIPTPEADNSPGVIRPRSVLSRPPIRIKDRIYRLTVRAWDDVENRAFTPGDPPYVEAVIEFTWVDTDTGPTGPATMTATQEADGGPGVFFSWTRASVPDYWGLKVDGILVLDKVPAVDWQTDVETYGITYYGLEPGVEHTIEVLALEVQ